jgi:methylenetetrahydrofolate reductase (NADPH)
VKESYSELMKALRSGRFVLTGEIQPKKTTLLNDAVRSAREMHGHVVACNVTDDPRGKAYLSSLVVSHAIQRDAELEAICQMTVRDRNRIAITSELLGAAALGIKNVLTMSGDHTSLSDNPCALPVYDLDTAHFVKLVRRMVDDGVDLEGNRITGGVRMHVGIVGNPNAEPLEAELLKIARKVTLGADFMQTQVVFDMDRAKSFLREMERHSIPVLPGIFPCRSHAVAEFVSKNVPGIRVPHDYLDELKRAESSLDRHVKRERVDEVNFEYFSSMIRELRKTTKASGAHVMAFGYEEIVKKLASLL